MIAASMPPTESKSIISIFGFLSFINFDVAWNIPAYLKRDSINNYYFKKSKEKEKGTSIH